MMHRAWSSKVEVPFCFPRSSIKFQGHTLQNITNFDPNWAFPDYRPVAAFKSLRFALFPRGSINNIPVLVQIMAWHWSGYKPLSETIMDNLLMHICVARPQWVNTLRPRQIGWNFADNILECIFLNEDIRISINFSLRFVPQDQINNIPALV